MAYAYWKSGKVNDTATFDLFFRKNPFKGEFTIFAGLSDCLNFLENFHYSETGMSCPKRMFSVQTVDVTFKMSRYNLPKEDTSVVG